MKNIALSLIWCVALTGTLVSVGTAQQPLASISQADSTFLRMVQHSAYNFFWSEANASNGLIKDRSTTFSASSIASVGFGLTSICVAVDNGWVTRAAAADRVRTTLLTFWNGAQGYSASGVIGLYGFFFHFLDMTTATRSGTCELSTIDSALLLAGILYCQQYFDGTGAAEQDIRAYADSIYRRTDFEIARDYGTSLNMGWTPEKGWLNAWWIGYNEAMVLYILALGSPTHPVTADLWNSWTSGYNYQTQYGYAYVVFPPLFGHQYSHCWIDFRGIRDAKMSQLGLDYFENSRRATLAQQAYCKANPSGFPAYSDSVWGITASDDPYGYSARGAPPAQNDNGTLVPTAPGGSMPFAPQKCLRALKTMYAQYCVGAETRLWGPYGFRDAFNLKLNWFDSDYIGIDQGPIVIMIENFFTQKVWNTFGKSPYIQSGLRRAGFSNATSVQNSSAAPRDFSLAQNFPNPFNPSTTIRYQLPEEGSIILSVWDALGRRIGVVDSGWKSAGSHEVDFSSDLLSSGVYFYTLEWGAQRVVKSMILLK